MFDNLFAMLGPMTSSLLLAGTLMVLGTLPLLGAGNRFASRRAAISKA